MRRKLNDEDLGTLSQWVWIMAYGDPRAVPKVNFDPRFAIAANRLGAYENKVACQGAHIDGLEAQVADFWDQNGVTCAGCGNRVIGETALSPLEGDDGMVCAHCLEDDYKKLESELDELKMKWIPVAERLPDLDQDVLVFEKWPKVDYVRGGVFARNADTMRPQWQSAGLVTHYVTHWMPYPEAPSVT